MSTYTKTTNFTAKDNLTSGDPAKVIKGSEFDTEFNAIETAVNSKADKNNGTHTGTTTIATADIDNLQIDSVAVTATAAELNTLDGITASTAELNITDGLTATTAELNTLDGITSTTTELNKLDGFTGDVTDLNKLASVTATATEINVLDGSTATTADLNKLAGVTATSTELNLLDGVTATTAELNYVDGVTSNIQTQLDGKQPLDAQLTDIAGLTPTDGTFIVGNGTNFVAESGDTAIASLGITATATELNTLDGITATTTELNYTDGVTSNIQTQLDSMVEKAGDTMTGDLSLGDSVKAKFGAGDDLQIYHDSTTGHSYIKESGSGDLILQAGNDLRLEDPSGNEYLRGNEGASVDIAYNGSKKLATTSTGVDVTGTVTADGLTVESASGNSQLYITTSDTTSKSQLIFGDSSDSNVGGVQYNHTDNSMQFHVGNIGEKVRIDSSGNLLVGTTQVRLTEFGQTSSGINLLGQSGQEGQIQAQTSGTPVLIASRRSSDGDIIQLRKDGSTVGSIGTYGGDLTIGTGDTRVMFDDANDRILPRTTGDSSRDAAIDIGASGGRFKDLYLSGGVQLGVGNNLSWGGTYSSGSPTIAATSNTLNFYPTGNSLGEAMRLDASGNLVVGKTSTALSVAGTTLFEDGTAYHTVSGNTTMRLNRLASDGDIIDLRKDGSTVGSIGTASGDLCVGVGNTFIRYTGSSEIVPASSSDGNASDGIVDLGNSGRRFKDLYLSGGTIEGRVARKSAISVTSSVSTTHYIGTSQTEWQPLYIYIKVASGRTGLQENQGAWYLYKAQSFNRSISGLALVDSGGNTSNFSISITVISTSTADVTIQATDSGTDRTVISTEIGAYANQILS